MSTPATSLNLAAEAARLQSPAVMLETLHLAYQHALDQEQARHYDTFRPRLDCYQERDLGRRLAVYWGIEQLPPLDPADDPARLRHGYEMVLADAVRALKERDEAREALEACRVFITPHERLKGWDEFKEDAARRLNRCLDNPAYTSAQSAAQ